MTHTLRSFRSIAAALVLGSPAFASTINFTIVDGLLTATPDGPIAALYLGYSPTCRFQDASTGPCYAFGAAGNDTLSGACELFGLPGASVVAECRADGITGVTIFGSPGADYFTTQASTLGIPGLGACPPVVLRITAGAGHDQVITNDGCPEQVDCGAQIDLVQPDGMDTAVGCERRAASSESNCDDACRASLSVAAAGLQGSLPVAADATTRAARKAATRLELVGGNATKKLSNAGVAAGKRQRAQFAKARKTIQKLLAIARRADAAGLLGVPLADVETLAAELLALIPA